MHGGACILLPAGGVNLGLELGADELEDDGEDDEGSIDDADEDAIEAGEEGYGSIDRGGRAGSVTGGARAVAHLGIVAEAAVGRDCGVAGVGIDVESINARKVEADNRV